MERVRPPRIAINPGTEHFTTVEAAFRSKGFTNIRCEPLYDLRRGILYKPGTVKSVTINGEDVIYGFKKYDSDAIVVILYHSFYNRREKV